MQEVFEKIKAELKAEKLIDRSKVYSESQCIAIKMAFQRAIEIVSQVAEEYKDDWILCSKRLPEVPEGLEDSECPEFNVMIKGAEIATTLKYASDGTWFDDDGDIYDVIAWQPLPEPYKEIEHGA